LLGTIVHLSPSGVDLPEPGALPAFAQRHASNGRGPVAFIPGVLGSVTPDPTWTLAIISGTRAWDPSEQEWAAIEELLRHDVPVLVETTGGRGDFARSFATAFEAHWERKLEPVEELRSILGEETECDLDLEEIGWTSSALEHLGTGKHAHHLERAPMAYPAPLLVARFDLTHALLGRPALDVLGWRTPWVDALLERFMRRSAS
jgi:hypothetical protein